MVDWTPIIVAIIGSGLLTWPVAWFVRGRVERWKAVQKALHEERRQRYAQILNPYVQLLASFSLPPGEVEKRQAEIEQVVTSAEYKKEVFDLAVVAEDDVIRAYNRMMTSFQEAESANKTEVQEEATADAMIQFGKLLVEIRKSAGNRKTDLHELELLRAIGITDPEEFLKSVES